MAKTQAEKDVARFNERMREFQRQGLTNNDTFREMVQFANELNRTTKKQPKSGKYRGTIANVKDLTEEQQKALSGMLTGEKSVKGYREAEAERYKDILNKRGYKGSTKEKLKNLYSDLHDFINNNKNALYRIDVTEQIVHKPHNDGRLSEDDIEKIFNYMDFEEGQKVIDTLRSQATEGVTREQRNKAQDLLDEYNRTGQITKEMEDFIK